MSIYDYTVKDVHQNDVKLDKYKGKVLLIVNTASKCGNTPQYEELESLYKKYKDKGFEILDFPCNQFLFQAPGSDEELAEFCKMNYGTTFKTFAKIKVNGKGAHPLYTYLKENGPKDIWPKDFDPAKIKRGKSIKWNFTKFLVDREGNIVARFAPKFQPSDIEPYIANVI
ncbi:TPA: glutathione peroxidase [bacterium]|nr:glutathione peroxidase [bacterium]